jgi:phosphatidylglycerophosphate synthase
MNATAWRLPDTPLRASAAATGLAALAALIVLATIARGALPLGPLYAVKAATAFAAAMLLSIGFLWQQHPFARFGAANQITTVRALLAALVVSLIGEPQTAPIAASAAAASALVTLLDGVDGWLARRQGIASEFGARFDMETDALLILALSILAWRFEKAGPWVVLSGLLRYLFAAAGLQWRWLRAPLPPSRRRQAICVVQIVGLTAAMVPALSPAVSSAVAAAALAALAWSFLIDTVWLWRRAA